MRKALALFTVVTLVSLLSGCKRSEEAYDNRTLEKRSHVETTAPDDRKDPFRP